MNNYLLDDNPVTIFREDTKQKSLVSRSSKARTSKKTRLPTNKEVVERSGSVKSASLYDVIMPKEEFDKLSKKEKHKALEGYKGKFTRAELAKRWGLKIQSMHDMAYRLRKEFSRNEDPKPETPLKQPTQNLDLSPMAFSIVKEITGEVIQDFIMKALDFFTKGNYIEIKLSIKRTGNPKFKVTIEVDDTMTIDQFSDEVMATLTLLNKDDNYLVSMLLKEKSK